MAPKVFNSTLPTLDVEVKVEQVEQRVFNDESVSTYSKGSIFEASTSRTKSSMEYQDDLNEDQDDFRRRKRSLSVSEPLVTLVKGKNPLLAPDEDDDDDAVDSDRWEYDDDPGTDKESSLLRMGFCQKDVKDALEACGEHSDVNHLANYIMNNIVDLPDSNWEDLDLVDEDVLDVGGKKEGKKEVFRDRPIEELTDQGLLIFKKLQNMGFSFSAKLVSDAIQACGKDSPDDELVDYLLGTDEQKLRVGTSDGNGKELQNLTKLEQLKGLGCSSTAACLRAIDSNRDADIYELLDYIHAEELHYQLTEEDRQVRVTEDVGDCHLDDMMTPSKRRRKVTTPSKLMTSSKFLHRKEKKVEQYEEETSPEIHRNLKGFGIPGEPVISRELSEDISRPPYFYFENVALMPKDEWSNIQRHLYNISPEFVDSLNFSPCRRPRGYIHNLPVEGRADILPKPPMSIQELIPGSAGYWPAWDPRVKLNTINTRTASEFVRRQIQESLTACEKGEPSVKDIKTILFWARKWNLVWIRPGVLAPLCPEEVETCLGFDPNHTRVLYSPIDRVRVLGNSFQVNTVAYHLSVLRPMYRSGIRVLSLFSGIGGAEVALHKLGIFLKVVVSVEIDDKARMVVDSWWKTTHQRGKLIHSFRDVKELDSKAIQRLVEEFGGFDLVIGGSPCNNLSGNNRCTRIGLAGPASVTFFEFPRILADVRDYMVQRRR